MNPESPYQADEGGLIIRRGSELARLPDSGYSPMSEIISRSLVHIQTSKSLGKLHRIGEHELCGPDYRLVCAFAEDTQLPPEELLTRLLLRSSGDHRLGPSRWEPNIEAGRFKSLHVDTKRLPISSIPYIEGLIVETLHLELHDTFSGLDLSMFPNLTGLRSTESHLTELNLSSARDLSWLWCEGNRLSELDLSQVSNLDFLYCGGNLLTELDLSQVPNLTRLWCSHNQLALLDLSQVPHLDGLTCGGNQLTKLDLSQVPNLTELQCDCNRLTELDLSHFSNLSWLCCGGNQLTELDLSQVPNLNLLYCEDNLLTALDLFQVPDLTDLSCARNQLNELDIRNLWSLETLEYDPSVRIVQRPDQDF